MDSAKRSSEIFDFTAKKYDQYEYKEIFEIDTYGFLKDERLDFTGKSVVDVGCGLGECSAWFLGKNAEMVVSVDPSHQSLVKARKYCRKRAEGKKAFFIESGAPELPFKDNSYQIEKKET